MRNQTNSIQSLQSSTIEYIEQGKATSSQLASTGPNGQVATIVNEILRQLTSIKPAWKHALSEPGAVASWKKQWTIAFAENGIRTMAQVDQGIKRARSDTNAFMPSAGQFIEWCNPSAFSEVELIEAFTRMIDRKKPLNDVEHATRLKCGFQCKTQLPQDKAFRLFASYMKVFAAKQARGEYIARIDVPLLQNHAPSARVDIENAIQARTPKTFIEARMQRLRLQAREAKRNGTQAAQ
mgnify:CR=1 FL=1